MCESINEHDDANKAVEDEGPEDDIPCQPCCSGAVLRDFGGQCQGAGECAWHDTLVEPVKKCGQMTSIHIHTRI